MSDSKPLGLVFLLLKVFVVLLVIKGLSILFGYHTYIPIADEVFAALLKILFVAGGTGGAIPLQRGF